MTDLLGARLARREWTVTVEVVTPPPADDARRARVLALADAVRADARAAAIALTDRTMSPDGDPVAFSSLVEARSGKAALVHLAGKARSRDDVERIVAGVVDAGRRHVLLTGGDAAPGARRVDAVDMLRIASVAAPSLFRVAVLAPALNRPLEDSRGRAVAKREAGAQAFVAQVSWDPRVLETLVTWQAQLGVPILGAAMLLTPGRLDFLARHRIGGIVVPRTLRRRAATDDMGAAVRRLALDLLALRYLGYAGAHLCGVGTPAVLDRVLDAADTLRRTLGDGWRDAWRETLGLS